MVGLLLGEVVKVQKKHIAEKNVVGLLIGEVVVSMKKNTSSQRMWLAY